MKQKCVVSDDSPKFKLDVSETDYLKLAKSASKYNSKLFKNSRSRGPYLDSHTGVVQSTVGYIKSDRSRLPGDHPNKLFTYPAQRWIKRKRAYLEPKPRSDLENGESDLHNINSMENPAYGIYDDGSRDKWFDDYGLDDVYSDFSDFEDSARKKRGKRGGRGGGRGRRKKLDDDFYAEPNKIAYTPPSRKTRGNVAKYIEDPKDFELPEPEPVEPVPEPASGKKSPSDYCDFCLGDANENKKTSEAEELVSCSDCGRSGHPTCLQFTDNMVISVKKYKWQCIECKSCGLCGTSENDDQLLFCDDCDRGYHMYCLKPPLKEPPEGSWSCHLCIVEFHDGKKPEEDA